MFKTIIDLGKDTIYKGTGINNFEVFREKKEFI